MNTRYINQKSNQLFFSDILVQYRYGKPKKNDGNERWMDGDSHYIFSGNLTESQTESLFAICICFSSKYGDIFILILKVMNQLDQQNCKMSFAFIHQTHDITRLIHYFESRMAFF